MSLCGGPEPFVTLFQQVRVRPIFDAARSMNSTPVKPLQAVNQHRPILLLEDVAPDLDDSVRADANEQPVECGVMELAERKSVRYPRVSSWFAVGHDVGGVEQLVVPEAAERALSSVRSQHPFTKPPLMEPDLELARHVAAPLVTAGFIVEGYRRRRIAEGKHVQHAGIVELDREPEPGRLVADDEDRPSGEIAPGEQTIEVDERNSPPHERTEPLIVPLLGVTAAIRIEETPVVARPIVVGSLAGREH